MPSTGHCVFYILKVTTAEGTGRVSSGHICLYEQDKSLLPADSLLALLNVTFSESFTLLV